MINGVNWFELFRYKHIYDMCLFTNPWTFKLSSRYIHSFPKANDIENKLNR